MKALSEQGALANYRVLHFATHGALSGEISGGAEPGLILNPPQTPTERDDGYLSASEIAGLKLDADWVILSACNTAAGNAENAEALSGLARSFLYAGARTLLVSHWASLGCNCEPNNQSTFNHCRRSEHRSCRGAAALHAGLD